MFKCCTWIFLKNIANENVKRMNYQQKKYLRILLLPFKYCLSFVLFNSFLFLLLLSTVFPLFKGMNFLFLLIILNRIQDINLFQWILNKTWKRLGVLGFFVILLLWNGMKIPVYYPWIWKSVFSFTIK